MRSVTQSNIRVCSILGIQNFIATCLFSVLLMVRVMFTMLALLTGHGLFLPHTMIITLFLSQCVSGKMLQEIIIPGWVVHSMIRIDNYNYRNLPVNSCSLHSSHPQIMAVGCCANTVINAALG